MFKHMIGYLAKRFEALGREVKFDTLGGDLGVDFMKVDVVEPENRGQVLYVKMSNL